jgi:hypothetical protein
VTSGRGESDPFKWAKAIGTNKKRDRNNQPLALCPPQAQEHPSFPTEMFNILLFCSDFTLIFPLTTYSFILMDSRIDQKFDGTKFRKTFKFAGRNPF